MKFSFTRVAALHAIVLILLAYHGQCFQPPQVQVQRCHVPVVVANQAVTSNHVNSHLRRSLQPPSRVRNSDRRNIRSELHAASMISAASSPAGAFLILTGIVLIHECGHYLAARAYGIKVDEFSIGFGPVLVGFTALGNEFNFRAFPLGGYVRFPENYNITLVQEQQEQLREQMKQQRQENQKETAIAATADQDPRGSNPNTLGYRLANLLSLGALDQKRRDEEKQAQLLQQQQLEQDKRKWWKNLLGTSSTKDKPPTPAAQPLDPADIEIEYYDDPDLLQNRPWFQRAVVLSGGVVFNLLLAFSIFFGQITTVGLPQPVFAQGIVVSQNPAREAAANGILRKGDIVLGVNGKLI